MRVFTQAGTLFVFLLIPCVSARADQICSIKTPRDAAVCAVATNPAVLVERRRLEAFAGRKISASTILPSHPELSMSVADRRLWQPQSGGPTPTLNFYLSLAQKIEVGGQRSLRLELVSKETDAQARRLSFVELALATDAAESAYRVLAERERVAFGKELRSMGAKLLVFAQGRAEQSLLSAVDEDLLISEATRMSVDAIQGTMRLQRAEAQFRALLGVDPAGDLSASEQRPSRVAALSSLQDDALLRRDDLSALRAEKDAALVRARLFERERIPSVTLQATLQSDGFGERVLGGGLSVPIFLPAPLGPSRRGEIEEARGHAATMDAQGDVLQRTIRAEVSAAFSFVEAANATLTLFPAERTQRMRSELAAIVDAMTSGKLPAREAMLTARALVDYCERAIEAKLDAALASLALARAAALPLDEVLK